MAEQAKTKDEVIARLSALPDSLPDSLDIETARREATYLLLDALLLVDMKDVVDAYLEAKNRVGFGYA